MTDSNFPDEPGLILDRLFENLPGLAYWCEPEPPWERMVLKGQVEVLTGYSAAAFTQGDVTYGSLVIDGDRDSLERKIRASVDARRRFTETYRIRTRSGDIKHVMERGTPIVTDGTVQALEGIAVDITERKAYERRLERQNDLFAYTQQMAAVGGWELDPDTGDLRWTDQVNRIHGLPLDASPSIEAAIDFYHPEDRLVIRRAIDAAIREGTSFDHELRIVTQHGEQRWVRAKGVPQLMDGEVVRLRGAVQDITDRREREQSIRDEQAFTKSVFEALPDLLYAFDTDGTFTRWNDHFRRATGYTDEEIAAMEPLEFIAEQDRGRVRADIERVFDTGETTTVDAHLKTKAGELVPYEFTGAPMVNKRGTPAELIGIGRDVSRRMERQRRFEAVFNNTYQFTGLLDTDGTVIEANGAGFSFADSDWQSIIGARLWETIEFSDAADREAVRRGFERAKSGNSYRDELRVQGADGEAVIDFSIRPITDDDGTVVLLVSEGRDITAFKDRERLLQVLHRLLRHNIRNDLAVIRGYVDTLKETVPNGEQAAYADHIDAAARNLLTTSEKAKEMVNLILHSPGETNRLDVGDLVETVSERIRARYPEASIDVSVEAPAAAACTERIGVAIEQLIENGIEHNSASAPHVAVRVVERAEEVRIEIADNGPGISADEWSMVDEEVRDEPSQLRHGNGIGLLLARWTVDELGGTLQCSTEDGMGSVVTIRLPTA
ncbi:PAS domain-containing protein [Natrinema marinum]|uniref:PAS domain-containing protein n=1 Tax=Natrinema marinum TaxID=2961598 RepID=UPI0020C8FCAB|nr:PAS domain-containing protein [Natrinema marinum]